MQQLLHTLLHEALERWLNDPEACNEMDRIFRQMFFNAALYEHAFLGDTVESVLHAYSREKMNAFIYEKQEMNWDGSASTAPCLLRRQGDVCSGCLR